MPPDFAFERNCPGPVAGIDEVGRGPIAGPVVAAAVIFGDRPPPAGIDDSKRLSAAVRERLFGQITEAALAHGIGMADVAEIDGLNILRAAELAMRRAVAALSHPPAFCLVDGKCLPPDLPVPGRAVVGGDGLSVSIAAASILAKVTRDRLMSDLARHHPGYGWEQNAGYPTAAHREALRKLGATPHHRRSFRPVREALYQESLTRP